MEPVGGVLEQRRAGRGARGGTPSHRLGRQFDRQKIFNIKYTAGRSTILNATTNQKLVAATEGSMEGKLNEREAQGKRNSIVLGALDVELKVKT